MVKPLPVSRHASTTAERDQMLIRCLTEHLAIDLDMQPGSEEFVTEAVRRLDFVGVSEDALREWCSSQGFLLERNVKG